MKWMCISLWVWNGHESRVWACFCIILPTEFSSLWPIVHIQKKVAEQITDIQEKAEVELSFEDK